MKTIVSKNQLLYAITLIAFLGFTSACSDNEPTPELPGENGFYIVNEGAWGNGDASISFFDKTTNTVTNDVFFTATGENLGDQAQSMTISDTLAFIVVQNSGKIEVFDIKNNQSIATIGADEGIVSPRYLVVASSEKAYVSDWGADGISGTIKVIDLNAYEVTKTIETGQGTNRLLLNGEKLYAANAGGWGYDNTVAIIDTNTDTKVGSVEVGDNPNSIAMDASGAIWVSASGKVSYNEDWSIDVANSTTGSIAKINTNDQVEFVIEMPKEVTAAKAIQCNTAGTFLLFKYDDGIYSMSVNVTTDNSIISRVVAINNYGFSIDPSTDHLIILQAPDFSSAGTMFRYASNGSLVDQYEVGIGPNSAAF